MQQSRDLLHLGAHAGDVRGGGERADAQPVPVLGRFEQLRKVREVNAAVRREVHFDDRREALPPRHFVRVVLIGPDEHDGLVRLLEAHERLELLGTQEFAQLVAHRLARRRRQVDAEDLLQLVDGTGGARPAGDDPAVGARVHGALDGVLRLVQQAAHAAAGEVVLGVRVRVDALQRLQVALEEDQAAARGGVVAVDHQAAAERRVERRVDADDLAAEEIEGPVVHAWIIRGGDTLRGGDILPGGDIPRGGDSPGGLSPPGPSPANHLSWLAFSTSRTAASAYIAAPPAGQQSTYLPQGASP